MSRNQRKFTRLETEYNVRTGEKNESCTWVRVDIEFLSEGSTRKPMREDRGRGGDVGLNTRGEVSYLRATTYYFVCYINMIVFIDNKSRLHQWMKKKKKKILDARKKSKCVGNKASRNFTRVLLGHYPRLEILLKHRCLNNKCEGTAAFFY